MCIQTLFRWKPDNLIDWSIDEWRPAVVSALFARGDERKWYEQLPFSSLLCYYYSRSAAFSFSFFTTAVDGSCVLYANMCWRTIISRLLPPPLSLCPFHSVSPLALFWRLIPARDLISARLLNDDQIDLERHALLLLIIFFPSDFSRSIPHLGLNV